jgi:hypothetical protein
MVGVAFSWCVMYQAKVIAGMEYWAFRFLGTTAKSSFGYDGSQTLGKMHAMRRSRASVTKVCVCQKPNTDFASGRSTQVLLRSAQVDSGLLRHCSGSKTKTAVSRVRIGIMIMLYYDPKTHTSAPPSGSRCSRPAQLRLSLIVLTYAVH